MGERSFNFAGPALFLWIALAPDPTLRAEPLDAPVVQSGDTTGTPPPQETSAAEAAHATPATTPTDATAAAVSFTRAPQAEPWGPVQLVVYKSSRRLALYRDGSFEREFTVVLGMQPEGRKRHAHDARTPEGLYRVIGKSRHPRWQHFVALDYPNGKDREAYAAEVRAGRVPLEHEAPFGIGGEIGIHGNDRPDEQARGVDWTKGCVAMREQDIAAVAEAVGVGTPVWIVP
jgi:murein L,D-transpeptidase YafK